MLKLLFNKKALFGALVAGATSLAFFSNVNLNTERAHAMPQEAQPNIYLRTVFQTHRPILADVGARLGCEEERAMETNPAPRGLSQEHADTLIEAFERASTPLAPLCLATGRPVYQPVLNVFKQHNISQLACLSRRVCDA